MEIPLFITQAEFNNHYQSDFWQIAARRICKRHKITFAQLVRAKDSEHIIFLVDRSLVIKIFAPFRNCFEREKKALEFAWGKTNLNIPDIVAAGEFENFSYLVMTQLAGELVTRDIWLGLPLKQQINVATELAAGLKELHSHNADEFDFDWSGFVEYQASITIERQITAGVNPEWIEKLPDFLEKNLPLLPLNCPARFLHGDVHFGNLLFQQPDGNWRISGLIDFADSLCGFHEFDFVAVSLLMFQGQGEIQREFFRAYGYADNQLDESLRKRLMLMTVLYECSDLRRYALRLKPEAINFSLEELEKAIWNFTE